MKKFFFNDILKTGRVIVIFVGGRNILNILNAYIFYLQMIAAWSFQDSALIMRAIGSRARPNFWEGHSLRGQKEGYLPTPNTPKNLLST